MCENSTLQHNISILIDKQSDLPEVLLEHEPEGIELFTSRTGLPVLKKDGLALHSLYDPVAEAKRKVAELNLEFVKYIVVFGFGMGYLVEEVRRASEEARIIVFEPDLDVLKAGLSSRRFDFKPGEITIHNDVEAFHSKAFFAYRTSRNITVVADPVWRRKYPALLVELDRELRQFVTYSKITENTANLRLRQWINFLLHNLKEHAAKPSLLGLRGKFKGIPAVVVSAGPSLEKNVQLLKGLEERVIIIAVNTAYRALKSYGITPHIVAVIESYNVTSMFEGLSLEETTLITPLTTNPELLKLPFGRSLSFVDNYPTYSLWLKRSCDERVFVDVGGSVSCTAYSLGRYLGADPVLLIGQDLAYTGGRCYAKGTNFEEIELEFNETQNMVTMKNMAAKQVIYDATDLSEPLKNRRRIVQVEGWHGGQVPSSEDFKFFRTWFEGAVRRDRLQGLTGVNATEGGAYIKGFEHISLGEALKRYSERMYEHHFNEEVARLQPLPHYSAKAKKAMQTLVVDLMEVERLAGRVVRAARELTTSIEPSKKRFHRRVRALGRLEGQLNKKTSGISLLQGYSREVLSSLNTDPQVGMTLPEREAWERNLTLSVKVSEGVLSSAEALRKVVEKELKEQWEEEEELHGEERRSPRIPREWPCCGG